MIKELNSRSVESFCWVTAFFVLLLPFKLDTNTRLLYLMLTSSGVAAIQISQVTKEILKESSEAPAQAQQPVAQQTVEAKVAPAAKPVLYPPTTAQAPKAQPKKAALVEDEDPWADQVLVATGPTMDNWMEDD